MINAQHKKMYDEIAAETGLQMEPETGILFGTLNGYSISLSPIYNTLSMMFNASVRLNGMDPDKELLSALHDQFRFISKPHIRKSKVTMTLSGGLTKGKSKTNIITGLNEIIRFFSENGFQNCDEFSGEVGNTSAYFIEGSVYHLNEGSFEEFSKNSVQKQIENDQKKESFIPGIIGAFLGSIIGAVVAILVGQLGYVSVWSGLIMGICTFKGYEILGKKFSIKGAIACFLIMAGMVYLANRIDYCIALAGDLNRPEFADLKEELRQAWGMNATFFDIFRRFADLVKAELVSTSTYYRNLVLLYIFSGIGAAIALFSFLQGIRDKNRTRKLAS